MLPIRTWHTYLGILIAPSVIFFALSGSLQLFGLHEAHGQYKPPVLIEKFSALHKDQVFTKEERAEDHAAGEAEHEPETGIGTLLLKWYFLLVAVALSISTVLGLWMGLTHIRHKRTGWWLLAFGILGPTVLTMLAR